MKKDLKKLKSLVNKHIRFFFSEYGIDAKKEGITVVSNPKNPTYAIEIFKDRIDNMYGYLMHLEKEKELQTTMQSYVALRNMIGYVSQACSLSSDEDKMLKNLEEFKDKFMQLEMVIEYRILQADKEKENGQVNSDNSDV